MQAKVLLATFPFGGSEHHDVRSWIVDTVRRIERTPGISHLAIRNVNDTPITMSRNLVLRECLANGIDYCLMVDSDMRPDMYMNQGYSDVKPFWDSSFAFMKEHHGPCVIGAPYCGPPPVENVYVFRWSALQNDNPDPEYRLDQFAREEATLYTGISEVAALPTGVCLIDMRAIPKLKTPWFDYEWTDEFHTQKASTEDVFFSRNLGLAKIPQYCNWDAWAGHWKAKLVGRPKLLTRDAIHDSFKHALKLDIEPGQRKMDIPAGGVNLAGMFPNAKDVVAYPEEPPKAKAS